MNSTGQPRGPAPHALSLEQEIESVLHRLQQRRSSVAGQHTALHSQLQAKMRMPRILLLAASIGLGFGFVNRARHGSKPAPVPQGQVPATAGGSHWVPTLLALVNSVMALQAFRSR